MRGGGEKAVAANNCDNLLTCHRAVVELVGRGGGALARTRSRRDDDKNSLFRLKLELRRSGRSVKRQI